MQLKLRSDWRKTKQFQVGSVLSNRLTIFPHNVREVAIATCRIQIMGWDQGNHKGNAGRATKHDIEHGIKRGRWVYTRLQTYGQKPTNNNARWSKSGANAKWIEGNSFDAANDILACFDLSIDDILDNYGDVGRHDRIILDLPDIIETLKPELLQPATAVITQAPE